MKKRIFVVCTLLLCSASLLACGSKTEEEFMSVEAIESYSESNADNESEQEDSSLGEIDTSRARETSEATSEVEENAYYLFTMPDLTNKSIEDVMILLNGYDIDISSIVYEESIEDKGFVIKQSIPANEEVKRGESLQLTISKGIENITVPNLIGLTKEASIKTLEKLNLRADYSSDKEIISYQNYKPGDIVAAGTVVTIK